MNVPLISKEGLKALGEASKIRARADPPDHFNPTMAYMHEPVHPPRPLYQATYDIEQFHEGGEYDASLQYVVQNAMWYAASLGQASGPKDAWVFDIDETSLSGYEEMKSIGFGYVPKLSHEWILSASAPAIQPTLQLYTQLQQQGFKIIFLTGRHWDEADATAQNLASEGFTKYETLIVRTPAESNMTATDYKSARRTDLVENQGYNIVGCVGDQWSDLNGPYAGFKVKLPNYIYYLP